MDNDGAGANNMRVVKLPPFWAQNAAAWFRNANGQFALHGCNDELAKFYNVLNVLPEPVINRIADFVEAELPADAYTQLRQRLVAVHQLSDYQRVEALTNLPPIGDQKPSDLLAEMTRLCPRGQEANIFFVHMFLSRLPRDMRMHLSGMNMADRAALVERADELWLHRPTRVAALAAVAAEDENEINAVRAAAGKGGQRPSSSKKKKSPTGNMTGAEEEMKNSGLCFYHFRYADNARMCRKPCAWQGN